MYYQIPEINQFSQAEFTEAFGEIFEQTPSIATKAWCDRPFEKLDDLYQSLVKVVKEFSIEQQLQLICAHPDLGSRLKMAESSVQEQSSVGLDRLSPEEFEMFQSLNQEYRDRFGFPFIIAVRNHTRASILEAFRARVKNDRSTEIQTAISEILEIGRFRLCDRVSPH